MRDRRKPIETVQIARSDLAGVLRDVPKELSDRLIEQVGKLLSDEIEKERERCADACRRGTDGRPE